MAINGKTLICPLLVFNKMKIVLVKYKEWAKPPHALLDGCWVNHSKVVEVDKLTDLNNMFKNIKDIKVLHPSWESCQGNKKM